MKITVVELYPLSKSQNALAITTPTAPYGPNIKPEIGIKPTCTVKPIPK